jgi:repressor of nif and glnA expression
LKIGAPDASAIEIMEIMVNVLARPYHEKTSGAVIAGGIKKMVVVGAGGIKTGIEIGIDALDKMTAPPKKKD